MSLECGECERDLRGGHDPSCSRYVQHADDCPLPDDYEMQCTCQPKTPNLVAAGIEASTKKLKMKVHYSEGCCSWPPFGRESEECPCRCHEETPTEDPLDSLQTAITTNARDWSVDKCDAWLYGILVGWDDDDAPDEGAMADVAARHGWSDEAVARLRRLRAKIEAAGFWSELFPGGVSDAQIQRELGDFYFVMTQVPKVYMHVTDGRISKINTFASSVIQVADERVTALFDELEAEVARLQSLVRRAFIACEARRDSLPEGDQRNAWTELVEALAGPCPTCRGCGIRIDTPKPEPCTDCDAHAEIGAMIAEAEQAAESGAFGHGKLFKSTRRVCEGCGGTGRKIINVGVALPRGEEIECSQCKGSGRAD